MSTVAAMEITVLVGAAESRITGLQAVRLEHAIRRRCIDGHGRPWRDDARACLQLADVLAEDLAAGVSPEPIELGRSHVEGLCEYVIEEEGSPTVRCSGISMTR